MHEEPKLLEELEELEDIVDAKKALEEEGSISIVFDLSQNSLLGPCATLTSCKRGGSLLSHPQDLS